MAPASVADVDGDARASLAQCTAQIAVNAIHPSSEELANFDIQRMPPEQPNNPLHGITLRAMVEELVAHFGFEKLARRIKIRAFAHDPSVKSALTFLRRTPWARRQVELLYLQEIKPTSRGPQSLYLQEIKPTSRGPQSHQG